MKLNKEQKSFFWVQALVQCPFYVIPLVLGHMSFTMPPPPPWLDLKILESPLFMGTKCPHNDSNSSQFWKFGPCGDMFLVPMRKTTLSFVCFFSSKNLSFVREVTHTQLSLYSIKTITPNVPIIGILCLWPLILYALLPQSPAMRTTGAGQ